jgi:hypothetical protein
MRRKFMAIVTKYYSGYGTKKNKMGGTCGTYVEQEWCIQGFGRETENKRPITRPESIILKLNFNE